MKKLLLAGAFMLMASVAANAQFMTSSSTGNGLKTSTVSNLSADLPSQYGSIKFTYSPVNTVMKVDDDKETEDGMNALGFGWTNANIISGTPAYFEYGLGVKWMFEKDTEKVYGEKYTTRTDFITMKLPVGLACRINIPNTKVTLVPAAGFDFLLHLSGQSTVKYDGEKESTNLFGDDSDFRRFNIDWHIGGKIVFDNCFFIGAEYEGPVRPLYKEDDTKMYFSMANLSIGLEF